MIAFFEILSCAAVVVSWLCAHMWLRSLSQQLESLRIDWVAHERQLEHVRDALVATQHRLDQLQVDILHGVKEAVGESNVEKPRSTGLRLVRFPEKEATDEGVES